MTVDPIERLNLTFAAGAVAASFVWASPVFAASLAFGAALEAFNFRGLLRSSQFFFWGEIRSSGGWIGIYGLRFTLLVLGVGSALWFGADPAGLLIGLSLIMPAAVIEAWRARPAVDPNAPAIDFDDPSWDRWSAWLAREREPEEDEESA